jgi:glycosyltransferase involved in cell wall biosynthesis
MRILIVNRALGTFFGGGESFDLGSARELGRRGHAVTVVTGRPLLRPAPNRFEGDGVAIEYLPVPGLRRLAYLAESLSPKLAAAIYQFDNWLFERRALAWLAKGGRFRKFDVVQCCSLFRLPEWCLRRWSMPVVSWLPGPPSGRARARLRRLIRHPRFGLFARGATCAELEKRMKLQPGSDFVVIEPGIDLRLADIPAPPGFRARLGVPDEAFLGATVARLIPVKNHRMLVEAVALAAAQIDIHWLVLGDGPERPSLERLVEARGLQGRVHFLGHCDPDEVHACLAVSDVFALTSKYESFSIATLEAMAHRLPVLASAVGYLPELLHRSAGGICVGRDDVPALAEAITRLSHDRDAGRELGRNGRRFAEGFNWPRIGEKLEHLYTRVVEAQS